MLLDAGSGSLGGARPKASVTYEGKLRLAKFSHPGDEWDIMAWEKTALDLAEKAGIAVPARRLVRLGSSAALVLDRFDRARSMLDGPRIPYLSAMSLLGAQDGAQADYAEVAEALADWTCEPEAQLRELFRRVCLSVALHNTDDHLRNLGLIRTRKDWLLSPAFDINIDPVASRQRATAVYGETGEAKQKVSSNSPPSAGFWQETRRTRSPAFWTRHRNGQASRQRTAASRRRSRSCPERCCSRKNA